MLSIGILITLSWIIFILSPFWLGEGGQLIDHPKLKDQSQLRQMQSLLLRKYYEEERGFRDGFLSKREWNNRQEYLLDKYIDITRRLDQFESTRASQ